MNKNVELFAVLVKLLDRVNKRKRTSWLKILKESDLFLTFVIKELARFDIDFLQLLRGASVYKLLDGITDSYTQYVLRGKAKRDIVNRRKRKFSGSDQLSFDVLEQGSHDKKRNSNKTQKDASGGTERVDKDREVVDENKIDTSAAQKAKSEESAPELQSDKSASTLDSKDGTQSSVEEVSSTSKRKKKEVV